MSKSHIAGVTLSILAFILFVVNQIAELAGVHLNFEGLEGAVILGVFLACGLLVQIWKWTEESRSSLDSIVTLLSLIAHVLAEVIIWWSTRIANIGLPAQLPMVIVGGYWLTGMSEVFFRHAERQWKTIRGQYKSPEALLKDQVALLQERAYEDQQARALLEQSWQQRLAEIEMQRALLEQSLTTAQTQVQQTLAELEKRDKQLEKINERLQQDKVDKNKKYELVCDQCGWSSGQKDSEKSAEYAVRAHKGAQHKNGHVVVKELN